MTYDAALAKAWQELENLKQERSYSISFLADTYDIDLDERRVLSLSCNAPAKTHLSILILHYLIRRIEGLPSLLGEWISFKELDGGEIYYPTYRKRVIETILRKYKNQPESLSALLERFKARKEKLADVAIVLETFEGVPLLLTLWKGDDEFGSEANVLFDKSIKDIFCTEDITILAEVVAHSI
jgi:hypothetical protein